MKNQLLKLPAKKFRILEKNHKNCLTTLTQSPLQIELTNLMCPPPQTEPTPSGSGGTWGRGARGRTGAGGAGRGRGAVGGGPATPGGSLQGSQSYPAGVGPGLCEVVHILGERHKLGRLTGITPPPGAVEEEEEEEKPKGPPKPLLRRIIEYVREAWTGVKFALGESSFTLNF